MTTSPLTRREPDQRALTIRVPTGMYQAIERLAAANDRSMSAELRIAVRIHLAKEVSK